jgi:hypothetical protein
VNEHLPWLSHLGTEGENIRVTIENIVHRVKCSSGPEEFVNTAFKGTLTPRLVNGVSAAKPGFLEFGAGSGTLVSKEFGAAEVSGKLKIVGYEEQEIIGAA